MSPKNKKKGGDAAAEQTPRDDEAATEEEEEEATGSKRDGAFGQRWVQALGVGGLRPQIPCHTMREGG